MTYRRYNPWCSIRLDGHESTRRCISFFVNFCERLIFCERIHYIPHVALVIQRHKIDQYVFEQVRAGIEAETQFLYMPSVYAGRDSLTFALKASIKCLATLALSQASSATP
jgi:hypothetical protein